MTTRTRAEVYLLSTTVIWGSTFVAQKIGLLEMSAMMMIAIRFGLATVIIAGLFFRSIFPIPAETLVKGGLLGLLLFLGFVAQTIGLSHTSASKSAFITSLMIVFAPLFQVVMEGRRPTYGNLGGILVICTGLWFLTTPSGSAFNVGDALTVVCAIIFGLYIVYLDIVSKNRPAIQLSFLQVATCAILAVGIVAVSGSDSLALSATALSTLLYLTIFATVITTIIQTRFQKDTTPTRAVIIFSIEPVFATILAAIILGENVAPMGIVGGSLVVVGILLSELSDLFPPLQKQVSSK